ncbi:MAG: hydroxymethylbilane synthase [Gammaproteobacteria bacterium]|nr:hydroxymethylbilane synthase [Gammaproteobacteria bacterium]MYF01641.1 hydroxymethylbilane synthase [Gammaproteobacteria bacterium]MYI77773.1 hydroxymethylbilane synthase [Gammaproteobacteria bacterium]
MKAKRELRIASRASQLARIQAQLVGHAVEKQFSNLNITYVPVTTTGDRSAEMGNLPPKNKDDFVKEIEELLLKDEADLAVHSLKDVPSKTPDGLAVHTVLQREDPRDVLVGQANVFCLDRSAKIGTSSPRRRALLNFRFKTNNVAHIRGNVDTRLRKLDSDEYDAILLAAAGLQRMNLRDRIDAYLDPTNFIPAPCQGTLAVQFRHDDVQMASTIAPLQHLRVEAAALCEREIVLALNADCTSPIGVYCEDLGDEYALHAIVLNAAGTETLELRVNDHDPIRIASNTASSLIAMGVEELLHS